MSKKQVIRLTESYLRNIIKESMNKVLNESINETYIVYDGIKLLLYMNGEDMYIEYTENNRWILAGYFAHEKMWYVQENLDERMVGDGEDDIIDIAKTKSMPEALNALTKYIKQVMPLKEDRMKPFSEYENIPDYNRHRLHTLDRTTDFHSDLEKGDHAYCDSGELYPSADFTDVRKDFGFSNDADAARNFLAQKDFDKKWKDMKDRLKYTKQANSRPLHRKGSLNREL